MALYILMNRVTGLQDTHFEPGYAVCLNSYSGKLVRIIRHLVVVGLFLILPLAVTIFSYRNVLKKIREHNMGAVQAGNAALSSHEIRISRSLFVVVFAFMLCWLPLWVITVLTRLRVVANMPRNAQLLCTFCLSFSNAINPLIYAGMNPLFRKEFRKILRCESGQLVPEGIPQTAIEILNAVSTSKQAETATNNSSEQAITNGMNDSKDKEGEEVTAL